MQKDLLKNKKHIHFIGIGGSGMFPLVQILHGKGYKITGSDNNESDIVKMVRNLSIPVSMEQRAENIEGADLIVYTAAILPDNEELLAAKESDIETAERNDLLGYLTSLYSNCICVCGTHGKTTTTSMLTEVLLDGGMDPSAVIGGKLKSIGSYGKTGQSDILACESCEFNNHFQKLHPDIAVLLNIDNDHMDYFKNMDNLKLAFEEFVSKATKAIIYNGDDEHCKEVISKIKDKKTISFGFSKSNDFYAEDIKHISGLHTEFTLSHRGEKLTKLSMHVPGHHNILNAIAACVAALEVGTPLEKLAKGLENFKGAGRRFEFIGTVNGITVADDYAHHPTEVEATLKAAKELGFGQVWALHQPFTFSRTKALMDEFASVLSIADRVVLTDIMGSREKNTCGVYSTDLAKRIPRCTCFKTQQEAADYILENAESGDLVITMGCGDIYKAAKIMVFGEY